MARAEWLSLDGEWLFAFDDQAMYHTPSEVHFNRIIRVPFPPESLASGIGDQNFHPVVWYKRKVIIKPVASGQRLLLHFGAVDYAAHVWVNDKLVATHEGGHVPFHADITEASGDGHELEIVVRADDDPHDLAKPRGKQDWLREPHEIWYPRTTGIWQTVWLEEVSETRIAHLAWTPYLEHWEIGFDACFEGHIAPGLALSVKLSCCGEVLADDRYTVAKGELSRRIALSDPGIDDYRNYLLWSPTNPVLIDAEVGLWRDGELLDKVRSYTALRSVGTAGNRFMLNGRPYFLKMVLDQGYWPHTLLAPPSEDALRADVELAKALGFNGIRKHQKIEDPRWLYWCDRLGMMVWEEMPSSYRFTPQAVRRFVAEWTAAIHRDYSHPCIIAWVPLNESWGVPDLTTNSAHRDYVRALYHLTKTLDPTRPVVGNDGWEHVATDIITIHDYAANPGVLFERYATPESVVHVLARQEPGGRALIVEGFKPDEHPFIVSEFGGIAFSPEGENGWGYTKVHHVRQFIDAYSELCGALNECRGIAGFCYTQLADTFQEKNGLVTADRSPKADTEVIAKATRGRRNAFAMDVNPLPISTVHERRSRRRRS